MNELYNRFASELKNAENIFFWGYSLPTADFNMLNYLIHNIDSDHTSVSIVDYSNEKRSETNLMKAMNFIYGKQNFEIYQNGLIEYMKLI